MSHIFNQRRDGKPQTFAWKAVPRRGKVRSPAHAVLFIKPHPRRFGRLYAASPKTHFDMSQYSRAVSPKTLQSDARYLAGWSVFSAQVTSCQSAMTAGARSPIDSRRFSSSVARTFDRTGVGSETLHDEGTGGARQIVDCSAPSRRGCCAPHPPDTAAGGEPHPAAEALRRPGVGVRDTAAADHGDLHGGR